MEIDKSGIREGEVPAGADDTPITDSQHRFMNRYAKSGIHVGSQPFGHRRGRIRRNAALKVPGRSGEFHQPVAGPPDESDLPSGVPAVELSGSLA